MKTQDDGIKLLVKLPVKSWQIETNEWWKPDGKCTATIHFKSKEEDIQIIKKTEARTLQLATDWVIGVLNGNIEL